MEFDINSINTLFQIAGIGIIVAMVHTILESAGKKDIAQWVSVIGFIIVLFMVADWISDLFQTIKSIFLFQ